MTKASIYGKLIFIISFLRGELTCEGIRGYQVRYVSKTNRTRLYDLLEPNKRQGIVHEQSTYNVHVKHIALIYITQKFIIIL